MLFLLVSEVFTILFFIAQLLGNHFDQGTDLKSDTADVERTLPILTWRGYEGVSSIRATSLFPNIDGYLLMSPAPVN